MAARDVLFIAVFVFGIAVALFVTHNMMTTTVNSMVEMGEINSSANAVTALGGVANVTGRMDYIVTALFFGLCLAMIITGFFVGGIPIFMFIYFILIAVAVVISAILANTWETISTSSSLITTLVSFPTTNHILLNLPYYIGIVGFIGIVVMFAKPYIMGEA